MNIVERAAEAEMSCGDIWKRGGYRVSNVNILVRADEARMSCEDVWKGSGY